MKKAFLVAMLAALSTGCATQTYLLAPKDTSAQPTYDKAQTFFVSGLAQEQSVDASKVCNGAENVTRIETQKSFINGLLGTLSSGIYTPLQIKVYCK
ncbi:Bor family protein [Moraxella sp. Tifton1]|uniref:Bor family protein n=1 Tax=Moraxella oculi TaxID=2940516 RepID=UPI002013639B|nr:Bor family protein [Moraxella sp. Tifton1]MCL1623465.1 Bor family protein [Moraxella sp. Tifton1]